MAKHKSFDRKTLYVASMILFVFLVLSILQSEITGFNTVSVGVKGKMKGEIVSFIYEPVVNISDVQRIFVEFLNTGTENYTVLIEEYIYFYDENKLEQEAYYYDSTVMLHPGYRRQFQTAFVPSENGYYYIKVRVTYGSKKTEVWGSFYAQYWNYFPYIPAEYQPIIYYIEVEPLMTLDYPNSIELYPGRSTLTNIRVKNTGNATLHEVKLHVSSTNLLEIDVNPKESYYLEPNQTLTFLLDVYASNDIQIERYPIDFEVVTREVMESGTIWANISAYNETLKEEVRKTILNYEYLINELDREILETYVKGINVTTARETLELAKEKLNAAKIYYDSEEYDNAKSVLADVKELIKEAAFQLAQASFVVITAPAFSPFWILLIIILIALLLLFILRRRRKKEEKPKLLRTAEEEGT